tara:strand:- start:146 stop:898 length:753 start_codon:yes stop_codon:yes gene_type:complete
MLYNIYNLILIPWLFVAIISFFSLLKINAPYGKFSKKGWGKLFNYKIGWFIQEIISPITFSYFFLTGTTNKNIIFWILFVIWVGHYINRSIIFPLRISDASKIPLSIVLSAISFNLINGFINGYYIGNLANFDNNYLYSFNFIIGIIIFLIGLFINIYSDNVLIKIKSKKSGYQIPKGLFYNYISCPNYLGEILEWVGFAIICWSFPSLLFAIWTIANLVPRALSNHKWYNKKFPNRYPKNRKAILPFIL